MKPLHYLVMVAFIGFTLAGSNAGAVDYYPSISNHYYWNNRYTGNGSIKMLPSSSHICVLTEVGGNFRGAERLAARVYTDGYWYLEGTATQEIWGQAVCFARSLFKGQDNWLSGEFTASAKFNWWTGEEETKTALWWGDAASFLNGIGGEFDSGYESVAVNQSVNSFLSSDLHAISGTNHVWGLAYSYFVGNAHSGHQAKFVNAKGEKVFGQDVFYKASFGARVMKGTSAIITLAPVDEGMCYFTFIYKELIGTNFASIQKEVRNGVEHWVLKIHAPDGTISANARCFAFDQE